MRCGDGILFSKHSNQEVTCAILNQHGQANVKKRATPFVKSTVKKNVVHAANKPLDNALMPDSLYVDIPFVIIVHT